LSQTGPPRTPAPNSRRSYGIARDLRWAPVLVLAGLLNPLALAQQPPPLVPGQVNLSRAVKTAVEDTLLKEEERTSLQIFHGLLEQVPAAARRSPAYLLSTWNLHHPRLADPKTPALLRAEAAFRRGDLHLVSDLLGDDPSPPALLLRGRAFAGLGRYDQAIDTLLPLRRDVAPDDVDDATKLTAIAEAVAELARWEGRPAGDYHLVLNLLGRAQQQLDRLYWPALVAQARLLIDKDNPKEAVGALHAALRLNPSATEAWYLLGRVALMSYNFGSAQAAILKLRRLQPQHVLADVLEVEMFLLQKDPEAAGNRLVQALVRYPNHRRLLACAAAVSALRYDQAGVEASLAQYRSVAGENPLAIYLTGTYPSAGRQYAEAEQMLRQTIERLPRWPQPQIELGLLLNQAGKDTEALLVLQRVSELDPFNKRAINVLKLMEQLTQYQRIETDHFIIKYRDPIDGALADDMANSLEQMFDEVTAAFSHKPKRKTQIEILPDKRWFAIRITGMPWIWTIGACTGPVVAITPPRSGKYQSGSFDWYRVLRHEYTHTVTLDQTRNRIPHWFTEACAVAQEPGPRSYKTCQLLAGALARGELFDLEAINWAFVRPRKPTDRAQAYAQAHWMYQYITERYGHQTILRILELCREGTPQNLVVPKATGQPAQAFLDEFRTWAAKQVKTWGLAPQPPREQVLKQIKDAGEEKDKKLTELLAAHPDHPDLLKLAATRALKANDGKESHQLLLRYAQARPVDPWADRKLADVAISSNDPDTAISHLEQLDRLDQHTGAHAQQLTAIYRRLNQLDNAQQAARRSLERQPYNPGLREIAATIALQRGDTEMGLRHLKALTLVEPEEAIHFTRLAAIYHRLQRHDLAREAAKQARKLDPGAPVAPFLQEAPPAP